MINLVFAWLNLTIYILIGRYAYRKWFKTQLNDSIKLKQERFQKLQDDLSNLECQLKDLEADLILQKQESANLLDKLKRWQTMFMAAQQVELQAILDVQQVIAKNNQIKMQNLSLKLSQKQMLDRVLSQTTELLQNQFRRPEDASLMLNSVIDKLSLH